MVAILCKSSTKNQRGLALFGNFFCAFGFFEPGKGFCRKLLGDASAGLPEIAELAGFEDASGVVGSEAVGAEKRPGFGAARPDGVGESDAPEGKGEIGPIGAAGGVGEKSASSWNRPEEGVCATT